MLNLSLSNSFGVSTFSTLLFQISTISASGVNLNRPQLSKNEFQNFIRQDVHLNSGQFTPLAAVSTSKDMTTSVIYLGCSFLVANLLILAFYFYTRRNVKKELEEVVAMGVQNVPPMNE